MQYGLVRVDFVIVVDSCDCHSSKVWDGMTASSYRLCVWGQNYDMDVVSMVRRTETHNLSTMI